MDVIAALGGKRGLAPSAVPDLFSRQNRGSGDGVPAEASGASWPPSLGQDALKGLGREITPQAASLCVPGVLATHGSPTGKVPGPIQPSYFRSGIMSGVALAVASVNQRLDCLSPTNQRATQCPWSMPYRTMYCTLEPS